MAYTPPVTQKLHVNTVIIKSLILKKKNVFFQNVRSHFLMEAYETYESRNFPNSAPKMYSKMKIQQNCREYAYAWMCCDDNEALIWHATEPLY